MACFSNSWGKLISKLLGGYEILCQSKMDLFHSEVININLFSLASPKTKNFKGTKVLVKIR